MGKIITFYSYKGGVGRTMALANIAILLARWGNRVLMLDWDLEAPGIENYFKEYLDLTIATEKKGIIDFLDCIINDKNDFVEWSDCIIEVSIPNIPVNLHLITAGKRDDSYFKRVRNFDIDIFYEKRSGGDYIETLRNDWLHNYDFVLIDSRTGITDVGGICTIHLPDSLAMLFTATQQGLDGIVDVARRANEARQNFDRFNLTCIPILSRFETLTEFKISQEWLDITADKVSSMLSAWVPIEVGSRKLMEIMKIPYAPYFSFGEKLPIIEQGSDDPSSIGYAYETIAALIANDLESTNQIVKDRERYVQLARTRLKKPSLQKGAEEINEHARIDVLVILPYSNSSSELYDLLKKTLEQSNLVVNRLDEMANITEAYNLITSAKLLIVDVTVANPNIFQYLGIAHSIGKATILLAQSPNNVAFDVLHMRIIVYELSLSGTKRLQINIQKALDSIKFGSIESSSEEAGPIWGNPSSDLQYSRDIFMLTPFSQELYPIYSDFIVPSVNSLGLTIARADDFFSTQSIVYEIWSAINACKLIIADCTGRNPNVFYELGMASTIRKPILVIAQSNDDLPRACYALIYTNWID